MRACVRQFLAAAAETLDLAGPFGLVAARNSSAECADWIRRTFADQVVIDCHVPSRLNNDAEIEFERLPIDVESLGTLFCLDVLRRFDETQALLQLALSLLAPGGMVLVTADVGDVRPHEATSRVLTPLGLERLVADLDAAIVGWQGDVDFPRNLFLIACRPPVSSDFALDAGRFLEAFRERNGADNSHLSWPKKILKAMKLWRVDRAANLAGPTEVRSFSLHLPDDTDWKRALLDWQQPDENRDPRFDRH